MRLHASPRVQQTRLQYAAWLGNTTALLMISDNDIYLRKEPSSSEDTRLTDTGVPGVIYNGVPDWLYQEEVLPRPEAIWPSVDGSKLLFASFNDSKVTILEFPWFGTLMGQDGANSNPMGTTRIGSFPPSRSIRYPTPGSPNPVVDMWMLDLTTGHTNNATNSTEYAKVKLKPPPVFNGQLVFLRDRIIFVFDSILNYQLD